ncbi:unnamed protein product, partial [Prorocentrum cordatum]
MPAYQFDSEGLSSRSLDLLSTAGATVKMSGHQAILGGDWNMAPELLLESGFPEKLEGSLIKPSGSGTCRSLGGLNFLDCFVCTGGIAKGIQEASIVHVAHLSPHKPAHLQLHPRLSQLCALTFRKPPPIPKERPAGVGRAPPEWSEAQNAAEGCLGTALTGNRSEAQSMLDWAYGLWADLAEQELRDLTQETLPFYGARSKHPKLFAGKWVSHRFQDLMIEFREGAPEVQKTLEAILDPPSFALVKGRDEWNQYLDTIQALARALPSPEGRPPCSHWNQAVWLKAAQDVLSLAQKYVVKLQGEARRDGEAVDGFHMRHYSWLSDASLQVVRLFFAIFESLSSLPRQLQIIQGCFLAQFMDDSGLDSTGKAQGVLFGIKEGSRQLEHALVHECGCSISLSKAGQGNLVCSDGSVARELQLFLGDRTVPLCDSVVDLGIDFTAGRSRRKACIKKALRESKFKIRMANLKAKTRKVRGMKKHITSHAKKIWVSGPLPGVLYGSECHGISDGELHRVRQQAGSVMGPSCKGRSLTSLLVMEDEPTWLAAVAPIVRHSKELWCAHAGAHRWCFSFAELREAWCVFFQKKPPSAWREVTGPFSAMYMCLRRIQWKFIDWVTLENDFGEKLVLTE